MKADYILSVAMFTYILCLNGVAVVWFFCVCIFYFCYLFLFVGEGILTPRLPGKAACTHSVSSELLVLEWYLGYELTYHGALTTQKKLGYGMAKLN